MTAALKVKKAISIGENTIQHGAVTLEFHVHNDRSESEPLHRKKVQDLLTQMYVRAKKRGRPKREEEELKNAA